MSDLYTGFGTAVGLKKVGFKNVDLYESASQLGDVGAGINVGKFMAAQLMHRQSSIPYRIFLNRIIIFPLR